MVGLHQHNVTKDGPSSNTVWQSFKTVRLLLAMWHHLCWCIGWRQCMFVLKDGSGVEWDSVTNSRTGCDKVWQCNKKVRLLIYLHCWNYCIGWMQRHCVFHCWMGCHTVMQCSEKVSLLFILCCLCCFILGRQQYSVPNQMVAQQKHEIALWLLLFVLLVLLHGGEAAMPQFLYPMEIQLWQCMAAWHKQNITHCFVLFVLLHYWEAMMQCFLPWNLLWQSLLEWWKG